MKRPYKTLSVLVCVLLGLFPNEVAAAQPAEACEQLNVTISGLFGSDASAERTDIKLNEFYTDTEEETLYGLLSIENGQERYKAILKLSPITKLLIFAPDNSAPETYPESIENFIKPLTRRTKDKWQGNSKLEQLMPAKAEQCSPLKGVIPGKQFEDNQSRAFVRHYLSGKHVSTGKLECSNWGGQSSQFRFYEAFIPQRVTLKNSVIYIDAEYGGSSLGLGTFKYICDLEKHIQSQAVIADFAIGEMPTAEYLRKKSINASSYNTFEFQVLRNVIEGNELIH